MQQADGQTVCLSVSMTAVTDRQTDSHAAVSAHQTATSPTAHRAESKEAQMLHTVTARRSLLSKCHTLYMSFDWSAQEHAAFPLLISTPPHNYIYAPTAIFMKLIVA